MELAALLTASIIPPIGFLFALAGLFWKPREWKKYIPIIIMLFFIGAYVFEPPVYTDNFDLTRYLPDIEAFGDLSLSEAFHYYGDVLYARDLLFWIFGHLNLPHMVPAISTAAVYVIAFYITCDTAERYDAKEYIVGIILLQIAMLPYINLINNVRNVFGCSLIILAVYLDIVKRKRNIWVLFCYIFGCLMHLSAVIFIVFRVICRPAKKMYELVLAFPFFFSAFILILYRIRNLIKLGGSLGDSINLAIMKLYWYLTDTTSDYAVLSSSSITVKYDKAVMFIGMIVALILVYYCLRVRQSIIIEDDGMVSFVGLTASITLASSVFAMPNFWRFSATFYVMIGVLLIPYLSGKRDIPLFFRIMIRVYAVLGLMSFLMQCWKCTWFDFADWLAVVFTTNCFTILYDIFMGLISM